MTHITTSIETEKLTKVYHLYSKPEDRLKEVFNPFKKSYHHNFYALNNLSFKINAGETVGIIGKNGAGKSTLLKLITGVLTPTSGYIKVNGKIASLLELGAGFNPEMSGIENIYLNGMLMGFAREQMSNKVKDIIDFAGIGEFIHQQVKTYSSGMYARLGFSIAVNVDPDILIIDEALSVGDVRFQQKCIRKMEDFKKKGITILFVSHDAGTINAFCEKAVWIDDGKLKMIGAAKDVTKVYNLYMAHDFEDKNISAPEKKIGQFNYADTKWVSTDIFESIGEKTAIIEKIAFSSVNGTTINNNVKCKISAKVKAYKPIINPIFGFVIKNAIGQQVCCANTTVYNLDITTFDTNELRELSLEFIFPNLTNGLYSIDIAIAEGVQKNHLQLHWVYDCIELNIQRDDEYGAIGCDSFIDENKVTYQEGKSNE